MRRARVLFVLLVLILGAVGIYGMRSGWFAPSETGQPGANEPGAPARQATSEARPTFDIVRAEPDGSVVMAGRAAPGWTAIVEDEGKEIGRAKADDNGEWVIQPNTKLKKGEHALELTAKAPKGDRTLFSTQRLALSLADPKTGQPLVALTEEGKPTRILQMPPPSTEIASGTLDAPGAPGTASGVLPRPSPEAVASAANQIGFASVDYEDAGEKSMLYMSGHAQPGSRVALYVDNQLAGTVTADATGSWSFSINDPLTPGSHPLRADLVAKDARNVLARAEVNFRRSPETTTAMLDGDKDAKNASIYGEPSLPSASGAGRMTTASPGSEGAGQAGRPGVIIVKEGDTLWHIAQRYYGDGMKFTQIFKNNRKQIRDPHWIYPNQRFDLPE